MSGDNKKRAILGGLLLILLYVWGSNLNWLAKNEVSGPTDQGKYVETKQSAINHTLEYSAPSINPFSTPAPKPLSNDSERNRGPRPEERKMPPRPGGISKYIGYINRPPHSQALLTMPANKPAILELGDSLSSWKLIKIDPSYVVFQYEKERDTLVFVQ